ESWWNAEYEPPALAKFNTRLRSFYDHTKVQTGSKGDDNHLRGRHRSRNWCLNSRYCTNRAYGTTDARDKRGDGDWLRATDCGIQGTQLQQASKRLDTAVRAGLLPCVAEWFGTFDGLVVSGWYEGKPSSSDTSHLWHLHAGLWTEYANHDQQLDLLYQVITGDDMALSDEQYRDYVAREDGTRPLITASDALFSARRDSYYARQGVAELLARPQTPPAQVDAAALAAALVADPAFAAMVEAAAERAVRKVSADAAE
ncbi:MAG TPA: hypothetical protein VF163_16365, partial [Micromonosporaceae bacterium]